MYPPTLYLKLAGTLSLLFPIATWAQQPGDFDPDFGIDGVGQISLPNQFDFSQSSFAISRDPADAFRIAFTTQRQGGSGSMLHTVQMFDFGSQNPWYGTSGVQSISLDSTYPCKLTAMQTLSGANAVSTSAGLVAALQNGERAELVIIKNSGFLHAKRLHPNTRILGLHRANLMTVMAFGSKLEEAGQVGFVDHYRIADGALQTSAYPSLTPSYLGYGDTVSPGQWFSEFTAITSYSYRVGSRTTTGQLAVGRSRFPSGERKLIATQSPPSFPAQGSGLTLMNLDPLDESVPVAVNTDAVREHLVHMEGPQGSSPTRLWLTGARDTEFSLPEGFLPPRTETGLQVDSLLWSLVSHGSHYMQVRKQTRSDGGLQLQLVRFDWAGNPDTTLGPSGKKTVLLNSLQSIDAAVSFGNHLYLVGTRLRSSERQIVVLKCYFRILGLIHRMLSSKTHQTRRRLTCEAWPILA
jgi:hypothetical protein